MLTGGISQALDFVCGRFARPGDVVFVEEPSYPYSFQIFRDHGLEIVGVPMDGAGMDIGAPRAAARGAPPEARLHDPGLPQPDRTGDGPRAARAARRAVARARLHHRGRRGLPAPLPRRRRRRRRSARSAPRATCSRSAPSRRSSRPGLRLGWIQATPDLMKTLLASGALVSGGNFNHFTSHVVRKLMESGELAAYVAHLRASYAERAQAMDVALRKHLAGVARWQKPGGGYFFWLELPEGADCAATRGRGPRRRHRFPAGQRLLDAPAASAIACACPSPITRCPTSTRASRASSAPSQVSTTSRPDARRRDGHATSCSRRSRRSRPSRRARS